MLSPAHQQFLKTLSNPKRVEVMLYLLKKSMSVTEIVKKTGMEQSAVSHHLKRLKLCNFVHSKASGKERIYSVNEDTVGPLFRLMNKHAKKYCQHLCLAHRSTKCEGGCSPPSSPHGKK